MKFKSLIFFAIFFVLIFVVSCGGSNTEGNSTTSETNCVHDGAFNCRENVVMQCMDGEWQKIRQCGEKQKCNAVKGTCEASGSGDSTPDNPDTEDTDTNPNQDPDTDSNDTTHGNDPDADSGDTVPDQDTDTDSSDTFPDQDIDTDSSDTIPDADTDTDTIPEPQMDEGIYFGIIGFNENLYIKNIGLLNNSTLYNYTDFIDSLDMNIGTALYYADYTALNIMRDYPKPPLLKNVVLITFTDGLDNMSLAFDEYNPENYGSNAEYLNAIHNKIVNEPIHDMYVNAYSIGLMGQDVSDDAGFYETLIKLASSNSNTYLVSNMDEVNALFSNMALSIDNGSILIMLVLDCTTSLGSNDFLKMQQAAKNFVTTLVNGN